MTVTKWTPNKKEKMKILGKLYLNVQLNNLHSTNEYMKNLELQLKKEYEEARDDYMIEYRKKHNIIVPDKN